MATKIKFSQGKDTFTVSINNEKDNKQTVHLFKNDEKRPLAGTNFGEFISKEEIIKWAKRITNANFVDKIIKEAIETDTEKTKVKFLLNTKENGGDVFAFFPQERYNDDPNLFSSYQHIGQHSACSLYYAKRCRQASPEQYADLKKELEQIGYNLIVLNNK